LSQISAQRTIFDLVRWLALNGAESFAWGVLIRSDAATENAVDALRAELQAQLSVPMRVIEAAGRSVEELLGMLRDPPDDLVVIKGLDLWSDVEFESLDVMRSALARPGIVLLWARLSGLVRLFQRAPNLRSWIGGNVFRIEEDRGFMRSDEIRVRLETLSKHFEMTDDQVVALAKTKSLPPDPEFVEWLILLGRADLVD
jgi:hypothetical protein